MMLMHIICPLSVLAWEMLLPFPEGIQGLALDYGLLVLAKEDILRRLIKRRCGSIPAEVAEMHLRPLLVLWAHGCGTHGSQHSGIGTSVNEVRDVHGQAVRR